MLIVDYMRGLIRKMFSKTELKNVVGENIAISSSMIEKISEWGEMLSGNAFWTNEKVKSLRLEQGICKELANISLNEMTVKISDEKLNGLFKTATRNLNENLQRGLGLGSFIIRPLTNGTEYITPERFIPIEFDNSGKLINVVFIDTKKITSGALTTYYRRFEFHKLDDSGLTIYNKAYFSTNENEIGKPCPLSSVEEWAKLPENPLTYAINRPDFGYYRNPIPNTIDGSACGMSVFDSSINLIRQADIQSERINWEFKSGERAINVDETAIQTDGTMAQLDKRLYRGINIDGLCEDYSPAFRDANLINGLNAYLRRIEFNCSLAYGDLSDVSDVAKTATEIKTAKQRKYNMVTAIQDNLKDCLDDFLFALAFYNSMATKKYEFICDFKDSVLTDEETERKQDLQDVAAGIMNLWEYRMKWYGEDEETAKANIPQQASVIE